MMFKRVTLAVALAVSLIGMVVAASPLGSPAIAQNGKAKSATPITKVEIQKLDAYLKKLFGNRRLKVVARDNISAEVYIGDEFIGVLFVDEEDDDRSFQFQMAILDTDLQ